jgi:alpha-beta hydrolase superfamily lysophospholipase
MTQESGFFKAGHFYNAWFPEGDLVELLIISHGLGEHSGRYNFVVDHYVPQGYAVFALDHLGHGKTEGVRGHVDGFSQYDADLADFITFAFARVPLKSATLLGHSLGAVIAHHYMLQGDTRIKRLILSSPGYVKKVPPPAVKVFLGKVLAKVLPKLTMGNEIDVHDICREPKIVDAYVNDPLVHGKVSARFFTSFLEAMEQIDSAERLPCPVLYVVALGDHIVSAVDSKRVFDRLKNTNKKWIGYEDFYHEIFNENERERVFADVDAWLKASL